MWHLIKLKTFTAAIIFMFSISAFGQAYIGTTTQAVNLRLEASVQSTVVRKLPAKAQIFIISNIAVDGFYNVIYIETNEEGYVHHSYVKLDKLVPKSNERVFTPIGESNKREADVEIYNKTTKTLTLKLNTTSYSFNPHETRTISLTPGSYDFRASAPGVIPYLGSEALSNNTSYSWTFYIVTSYR